MNRKSLYFFLLTLAFTALFHKEYWGLNALISAILFVGFTIAITESPIRSRNLKSIKWWLATALFLTNGFASFYINNQFSFLLYLLSFFFFVTVHNQLNQSLILGFTQGFQSFFYGFYEMTAKLGSSFQTTKEKRQQQLAIKLLKIGIPLLLAIVFLKIYQAADQNFYQWTKFINLDWISWSFIGTFAVFFLILYGFYYYHPAQSLSQIEDQLKNNIPTNYSDKAEVYFGIENEHKIANYILILLITLLFFYNLIDIHFVATKLYSGNTDLTLTEMVHNGVDMLIFSIVLVILILTYIFRGQLNFTTSKTTKILALAWLGLNIIMVATTALKNLEYITSWGLTYKRIGVIIYLLLALSGLILTIIKVRYNQSIWFLIRSTSLAFFACFTTMGLINWDKEIANYNLSLAPSTIDFDYIHSLGDDTYIHLLDYYKANQQTPEVKARPQFWNDVFHSFDHTRLKLNRKKENSTWRSMVLREHLLLKKMNLYNLTYKKTPNRSYY